MSANFEQNDPDARIPRGDKGGQSAYSLLIDPDYQLSRSDLRLIAAAANNGWDVPQYVRDVLPGKVSDVMENATNDRLRSAALAALLAMVGANFRADERESGTLTKEKSKELMFKQYWGPYRTGRTIHKSR